MKFALTVLFFVSAPAFAQKLSCLCTGANGYHAEMSCKKFDTEADCHFEDGIAGKNVVWQKSFKASGEGILYAWSTNGQDRQEKLLKPGSPFDFQYYGDNDTYTMICELL